MTHPLDNPVWHALVGPHAPIAIGSGGARHFPRDVVPFSAVAEPSATAYADLLRDLPQGIEARLFRPAQEAPPPGWTAVSARPILQMELERELPPHRRSPADWDLRALSKADVAAMTALAEAAKPGPFDRRTVELGQYIGMVRDGRLVAMAGERFRVPGFVELSAIAVHPADRGRGIASRLMIDLRRRAAEAGEIPFRHVFPENPAAKLYEHLGFRVRTTLWVLWHRPVAS